MPEATTGVMHWQACAHTVYQSSHTPHDLNDPDERSSEHGFGPHEGNIRPGLSIPQVVTTFDLDAPARSPRWRPAPWVVPLFALSGIVLVPWTVFLVRSLPSTHAAAHWDIAWAGFDVGLALLLLGVAVAAWRRSAWLEGTATAAAALLVVDAWFDVMTSSTHLEIAIAIGEAVLIELPLAALCYLLARDAEQLLRRRTASGSP